MFLKDKTGTPGVRLSPLLNWQPLTGVWPLFVLCSTGNWQEQARRGSRAPSEGRRQSGAECESRFTFRACNIHYQTRKDPPILDSFAPVPLRAILTPPARSGASRAALFAANGTAHSGRGEAGLLVQCNTNDGRHGTMRAGKDESLPSTPACSRGEPASLNRARARTDHPCTSPNPRVRIAQQQHRACMATPGKESEARCRAQRRRVPHVEKSQPAA